MDENMLRDEIIGSALYRLGASTTMITKSLAKLREEDIWKKPNNSSNSVGNLILHLCGNVSQYIISSLGNTPDVREREKEFSMNSGLTAEELLAKLDAVITMAKTTISATTMEELLRKRKVQGYTLSGVGIITHVVEHYSYHTGQIAFWTKLLKDEDLGFYDGIDLTVKNN